MLAAFRVPAFSWYWSGQLLSNIGTWSQSVAQAWLVLDLTHSSVALGTITMLQTLPLLVLALVGGVVADRLAKRQLLVVTQIALTLQALTLGVLVAAHVVTIFEVGLLAFFLGLTNAPNDPAQQPFIPARRSGAVGGRALVSSRVQPLRTTGLSALQASAVPAEAHMVR
jgi:MFS family permease